ncbi:MAG: hypothetical protein BWY56_01711 [Acidobacteria bacterium ADurb.Bin340]|nr:MAG: hypothetical protein BWY56_01711 [Acidobacteria bacterium ADurb.Bin340]
MSEPSPRPSPWRSWFLAAAPEGGRLPGLDALRGLLVLHYHVVAENVAADGVDAAAETLRQALLLVSERMRPQQL